MNKTGVYVSEAPLPSGGRTAPHVCPVQLKQHCSPCHVLPFLPVRLASTCLLARSLFPWLADVRWKAARQFPLFKDSSVSSCLCRWQIHPSKMSTGREIFKEGRARGQRLLLFSPSPFFVSWAASAVLLSRADESACIFSLRNNVCGLRGFNNHYVSGLHKAHPFTTVTCFEFGAIKCYQGQFETSHSHSDPLVSSASHIRSFPFS